MNSSGMPEGKQLFNILKDMYYMLEPNILLKKEDFKAFIESKEFQEKIIALYDSYKDDNEVDPEFAYPNPKYDSGIPGYTEFFNKKSREIRKTNPSMFRNDIINKVIEEWNTLNPVVDRRVNPFLEMWKRTEVIPTYIRDESFPELLKDFKPMTEEDWDGITGCK